MKYFELVFNIPLKNTFTYSDFAPGEEQKQDTKKISMSEKDIGKRAEVRFGNRKITGYIIACHDEPPATCPVEKGKIKPILRLLDEKPILTNDLMTLAKWLSSYYLCSLGEAIAAMLPSARRETNSSGFSFIEDESTFKPKDLSQEQTDAVNGILSSEGFHYLYGKTGSGKTEVFLKVAEQILNSGKGVIYLVPEIGLTEQVIQAVSQRFGNTVAVLHSGLTPSQKLTQWHKILNKETRVVIGARSAVFAPVPDLGMIIIDEEHDNSYKSGNTPRYHARQVAMYRCMHLHIPLVMGSATPSVEAWLAMKNGSIKKHILSQRLAGGKMPEIDAVNLSLCKNTDSCLSPTLEKEIKETLEKKRQTILFLNRRGFTHFFRCQSCGYEIECKNCSVPLTYHKSENRLKCHYCGWSIEPPQICPKCGSLDIGYSGFGTEYIEEEVKAKFPYAKTVRIDTDSLTKKGELQEKINDFRNGKYDILLGTQMVAKGLNFPSLKLVGVIMADTGLHMPDFRAAERVFSLITQVAGRAGRFFPDGKVIVQSYNPNREPIAYACNGDIEAFYDTELSTRNMLFFPPYSRLVRLVFRSHFEKDALEAAESASQILEKFDTSIEILGPAECPLYKISANFRYQIILRAQKIAPLQKAAYHLLNDFHTPANVYVEVDVDPSSLL